MDRVLAIELCNEPQNFKALDVSERSFWSWNWTLMSSRDPDSLSCHLHHLTDLRLWLTEVEIPISNKICMHFRIPAISCLAVTSSKARILAHSALVLARLTNPLNQVDARACISRTAALSKTNSLAEGEGTSIASQAQAGSYIDPAHLLALCWFVLLLQPSIEGWGLCRPTFWRFRVSQP